jgi:hypothetical protein
VLISDQGSIRPDLVNISLKAKATELWEKAAQTLPSEHSEYVANYKQELTTFETKRQALLSK